MRVNDEIGIAEQTAVVILAAGRGTRMLKPGLPKVCFQIDGVPAINRVIAAFKEQGLGKFVIVVGHEVEKVVETVVSEHPNVEFVLQEPQLGTGHAAQISGRFLRQAGHTGPILVTMGDKYIEPAAITALLKGFGRHDVDLTLLSIPKTKATGRFGGRVLADDSGRAIAIIEKIDIARQAIVDELNEIIASGLRITCSEMQETIDRYIPDRRKQAFAVGELIELAGRSVEIEGSELSDILQSSRYTIKVGGQNASAEEIEANCTGINSSMYLFRSQAFYDGIVMIDNDNAQGEYYLTDIVRQLASAKGVGGALRYNSHVVRIGNADWVQGFNSPDELLAIQDYVRRKKEAVCGLSRMPSGPRIYGSVADWIKKVETDTPTLGAWLDTIYGRHRHIHEQKRRNLLRVLRCYGDRFGFEERVCIVRAPGRINLMGRHVDHRGGWNNCLAIDRETIAVAAIRADDSVEAVNVEPGRFPSVQFNIAELMGQFAFADWVDFVNSDWVRSILRTTAGDWGNYIKAAMLRLQHEYSNKKIHGVNIALSGNVPIAAGLSSSSTIVVATLQAAIELNGLALTTRQFIDLCGEGEWFVGSRGGSGDHAAIRLGQRGKIAHVGYLPFRVERAVDAPADYVVVIANSHIKATKSSSAKDTFNARIAAYNLGLELLKQRCPDIKGRIRCLRDVSAETLGCDPTGIYRLLLSIPEYMSREDFTACLSGEFQSLTEVNFSSHQDPGKYNVRGVLLFGIAEILRSRVCPGYLEQGRIEEFGRLMKVSHDGDRVSRTGATGQYVAVEQGCSDEYLAGLVGDLGGADVNRAAEARLVNQPGWYGCSTVEIDRMVDIACSIPGVVGAQIAGAGLGGCIMALVHKDCVGALKSALIERYYLPENLDPEIIECITAEGAGLADF
ncbi:MAG: NTP transferase domain-containing protein [Sedimentisphaerales bacterium]|nr:NTP transferase domain-containing protein [Sedimentisphaerales bacterium]